MNVDSSLLQQNKGEEADQ
ncbi:Protein of unknown function [Bacillus mycoides]|nr:Protein of unknown function [Bacillus mycoides]